MLETDLELLKRAALEAGKVALEYHRSSFQVWDKPDEAGPVTDADLAVNRLLLETLKGARPEYGWLSEESEDDKDRLKREACFVVDPIDGTRSFINKENTWSHSLAITREGRPVAGVVYLPALDLLFTAEVGDTARLNGQPIAVSEQTSLDAARLLAVKIAQSSKFWKQGQVPKFERHHRPSLAYRLCLVAQGRFDGMLTFRDSWEWDICAGSLIAECAGARVSDVYGQPLKFNNAFPKTKGAVAAAPEVHEDIMTLSDP